MKIKIIGLLFFSCLLFPTLSFAQNATSSDRQTTRATEQSARLANIRERLNVRKTALERHFQLRTDWLDNLIARLNSRITKLTDAGVVTTEAKTKLDLATTALASAKAKLPDVITKVGTALDSATPRQSFATLRTEILAFSDQIKQVHQQIVEVITMLKQAIDQRQPTAGDN